MNFLNVDPEEKIAVYNSYLTAVYKPLEFSDDKNTKARIKNDAISYNTPSPKNLDLPFSNEEAEEFDELSPVEKAKSIPKDAGAFNMKLLNLIKDSNKNKTIMNTAVDGSNYQYGTPTELKEAMRRRLGGVESGYDYKAYNPNTGKNNTKGSGAWGKYQYIWGTHGKDIQRITGVKTAKEFLNNPEAQEKYFDYAYDNWLYPNLVKIREEFKDLNLSDADIMHGIHFRGEKSFKEILREGGFNKKLESNNPTVADAFKKGREFEKTGRLPKPKK